MTKRRSPLEIRLEILENATEKTKPTKLMQSANLSYTLFHKYIDELKTNDLIEEIKVGAEERRKDIRTKIKYRITMKGMNVINIQKELKKHIG